MTYTHTETLLVLLRIFPGVGLIFQPTGSETQIPHQIAKRRAQCAAQ